MTHRAVITIAGILSCWLGLAYPGVAAASEASVELGAGGLSFAANPSLRIDQQDVLVTPDRISVTYTVRNEASIPQSIYVSFQLPDLDANAITDAEVAIVGNNPTNFVQATTLVDGQPVVLKTEQRAMALGLDITGVLTTAGVALYPFAEATPAHLEALSAPQRLEMLERGILKEDGSSVVPSWSLKTVSYWRQSFAPGQVVTILHSYHPVAGTTAYSAEVMPAQRKRACVSAVNESAIAKLSDGGTAPMLTSIGYVATPGAEALGPVRRFRLIVETSDPNMVVASCRDGLKQTGPMQFDWSASDYTPDEDFQLLFAR
jgi:hypothetical protein